MDRQNGAMNAVSRGEPRVLKDAGSLAEHYDLPGHLIRRCKQIAVSIFMAECKELDLTPIQYSLIAILKARPDIDHATLSRLAAVDRATTGNVVRRMEARGLVGIGSHSGDRRRRTLSLTTSGQQLFEQAKPAIRSAQKLILAPLTKAEREQFLRLLSKLVNVNNRYSRAPQHPLDGQSEP